MELISNGEGLESLRIVSGAVHPEREESDWKPCYNFLSLSVDNDTNNRILRILVYQRQWNSDISSFDAVPPKKDNEYTEFKIKLAPIKKKPKEEADADESKS